MKKKLLSKTHLKEAVDYEIKFYILDKDKLVCQKTINKVTKPFVSKTIWKGLVLIDNGYKIVEVLPKNKNYAMRVFVDKDNNVVERYFDIVKSSGVDEETNIPYYDDLYLDVLVAGDDLFVADQDELDEALRSGEISKEDYDLAEKTKDQLVEEIKNGTNELFNMDLEPYL